MSLLQLIGRFASNQWREYAAAALLLVVVAVLTVWVPRRIGDLIDRLVAGQLTGRALWVEISVLLAMGIVIYLCGWAGGCSSSPPRIAWVWSCVPACTSGWRCRGRRSSIAAAPAT